ncbi:MAG TPA: P1 family peptidase [Dermatophilaceae bacterium]|nr:P1 family peptidase [Dermatophilaceae bacterium]
MTPGLELRPGRGNAITDVPGIEVGHCTRVGDGWLTGTTVVLAPPEGAVGGVDVRGGGPGTRETDLLDPRNLVERVHAVVLTGGSAFGLAAVDGVMLHLEQAGRGFPVGGGMVVPIVPAAVLFDLGRGGSPRARPGPQEGAAACDAASSAVGAGGVGAATGAVAGGLKGGVGSASAVLPGGATIAALVAVNSRGHPVDPATGELYARRFGLPGEFPPWRTPTAADLRRGQAVADRHRRPPPALARATTIGVLATDATLTKAQCAKVAGVGHDGLARAIRPVHAMTDGDTLFALATCERPAPGLAEVDELLSAAADCVTRAVGHAILAARGVRTAAGDWPAYAEVYPSALVDPPPPR